MREHLKSRFGFLMLAAGCAVGLGNVWRFPYIVGENGGAMFVLVYIVFLVLLGYPLLLAELAIGRAAQSGIASALPTLSSGENEVKKHRTFWRIIGGAIFAGNFLLMIYYTDIAGWLLKYAVDYFRGGGVAAHGDCSVAFNALMANKTLCAFNMLFVVLLAGLVCMAGVVKGVERVTKILMVSLLAILVLLAAKALMLPGAKEGLKFYLYPDATKFMSHPLRNTMLAMGQAFFTLSVGVGCMTIFGSYVERSKNLAIDTAVIIVIDTAVAIISGLVIFPICYTCNIAPSEGQGLIFVALPEVFRNLNFGRLWGFFFFSFLAFAAFTTVVAVFECIIGGLKDILKLERKIIAPIVTTAVAIASLPCILYDGVLVKEDFAMSNIWLPTGALAICLFSTWRFGWGAEKFRMEVSPRAPKWFFAYMKYVIPLLIITILVGGLSQ